LVQTPPVLAKAPIVNIISPYDDEIIIVEEEIISIIAEAKDNTGVEKVEFFIDGDPLGPGNGPDFDSGWSIWTYELILSTILVGPHVITARATDTSGKTGSDSIDVLIKDSSANLPPIAKIAYSRDGYKYNFYPDDCYDPDGSIIKYEYEIFKYEISEEDGTGTYSKIDSYSCCKNYYCDLLEGVCLDSYDPPPYCDLLVEPLCLDSCAPPPTPTPRCG
jgi:chitinase